MIEAIMAIGWVGGILFLVLGFLLLIEISADRRGDESKWWVLIVIIGLVHVILNWGSLSWTATYQSVFSKEFLIGALQYLAIGVVYSMVEFRNVVNEAAEYFASLFKTEEKHRFTSTSSTYIFVSASKGENGGVVPEINKKKLADNITAWTVFWPLYLLNMIFGKFLFNMFNYISGVFVKLSRKYITKVFTEAFEKAGFSNTKE